METLYWAAALVVALALVVVRDRLSARDASAREQRQHEQSLAYMVALSKGIETAQANAADPLRELAHGHSQAIQMKAVADREAAARAPAQVVSQPAQDEPLVDRIAAGPDMKGIQELFSVPLSRDGEAPTGETSRLIGAPAEPEEVQEFRRRHA